MERYRATGEQKMAWYKIKVQVNIPKE